MSQRKKRLTYVLWLLIILFGLSLLVFGSVSAFKELSSVASSGVNVTAPPPNIGVMLSPEVAMGFAVLVLGLMIINKGYSQIHSRSNS